MRYRSFALSRFVSTLCCRRLWRQGRDRNGRLAEATESSPTPEEVLVGNWVGRSWLIMKWCPRSSTTVKDTTATKNRVHWAIETPASLKSNLTLKPDGSMTMVATVSTAEGDKTINARARGKCSRPRGTRPRCGSTTTARSRKRSSPSKTPTPSPPTRRRRQDHRHAQFKRLR